MIFFYDCDNVFLEFGMSNWFDIDMRGLYHVIRDAMLGLLKRNDLHLGML